MVVVPGQINAASAVRVIVYAALYSVYASGRPVFYSPVELPFRGPVGVFHYVPACSAGEAGEERVGHVDVGGKATIILPAWQTFSRQWSPSPSPSLSLSLPLSLLGDGGGGGV